MLLRRFSVVLSLVLVAATVVPTIAVAAPSDLLLTQYIEGGSFNKALEVGNTTGADVDLDAGGYHLVGYHNGNTTPTYEVALTGTLEDGGAWVFADTQASQPLQDVADHTRSGLWNGDDALVLYRDYDPTSDDGTVLDSLGQVGDNADWGPNVTLCPVDGRETGDTDPDDAFDRADTWTDFPQDTFDGIGDPVACGASADPVDGPVFVSEFHYDNAGGDAGEFAEVTAPAGTDLSGWSLQLYNGNGGSVYGSLPLTGTIADQAEGYGTVDVNANGLQNGSSDGIALVDATNTVVEFLSYEGELTATDGPAEGMSSTDVEVSQTGSEPTGASIERVGEVPGGWEWVASGTNTRGAVNPGLVIDGTTIPDDAGGEEPDECEPDTFVHELNTVDDEGLPDTERFGETVSVEAVVTANFLDGLDGVFVQEEEADADGDDATSEGIFVYLPGSGDDALAVGDLVCVSGTVGAFSGTYQLGFAEFEVRGSGAELPDPVEVELPVARTELAQRAGMRIELSGAEGLTITQNFFLGQWGELDLSGSGFLWHPGELLDPDGDEAADLRQDNLDAMIKLDDANSDQNPTPTPWLANGDVRAGSEATGPITGITHYQHGAFRVQPTDPDAVEFVNADNPRPDDAPDVLAGASDRTATATVASFNVLNYFTTFRERGAFDAVEFERQAAKIVTAITEMDADVVGLMEIENNFGSDRDALADLVDRLNAADTPSSWAAVDLDAPVGTDEISNAMIYRKHRVTPVGDPAIADHEAFVNPLGGDTDRNRPAIAQAFRVRSGHTFVAVVNHLKSKGSPCTDEGDPEHPIAGNCNITRTDGAAELARWLEEDDPTGTGSDAVAIIGDLNAYAMEAPVRTLVEAGYIDPLDSPAYSYTFDGEHGRLDHGLLSPSLAAHLVGAAIWHINTDEPAAFDSKGWNDPANQDDSEFRSSDHDPVLLGLQFTRQGAGCRDHRPGPHSGAARPGCPG